MDKNILDTIICIKIFLNIYLWLWRRLEPPPSRGSIKFESINWRRAGRIHLLILLLLLSTSRRRSETTSTFIRRKVLAPSRGLCWGWWSWGNDGGRRSTRLETSRWCGRNYNGGHGDVFNIFTTGRGTATISSKARSRTGRVWGVGLRRNCNDFLVGQFVRVRATLVSENGDNFLKFFLTFKYL